MNKESSFASSDHKEKEVINSIICEVNIFQVCVTLYASLRWPDTLELPFFGAKGSPLSGIADRVHS